MSLRGKTQSHEYFPGGEITPYVYCLLVSWHNRVIVQQAITHILSLILCRIMVSLANVICDNSLDILDSQSNHPHYEVPYFIISRSVLASQVLTFVPSLMLPCLRTLCMGSLLPVLPFGVVYDSIVLAAIKVIKLGLDILSNTLLKKNQFIRLILGCDG